MTSGEIIANKLPSFFIVQILALIKTNAGVFSIIIPCLLPGDNCMCL